MKITSKIRILFVLAISTFCMNNAFAQQKISNNYDQGFRLGFGINGGYALQDPYGLALGADARLQYDLSKRYSVAVTSGFSNLFVKGKNNDLGFIPVKLGFKAFVWNDEFYVLGEGGAAFPVTNNYKKNSVIIAPGIGYATKFIDVSLRYEHYSDFPVTNNDGTIGQGMGQLSLRLAYGFKL